ncbi:hypothetical protein ACFW1P_11390 [Paenibacillus sp. NPDC058910]|uniref:hypothetical protein n=1 Tax=unclassified Paenibacillus TaxID=185978 RepID=UPI00369E8D87
MKKKMMGLVSVLLLSLFLVTSVSAAGSTSGTNEEASSTDISWGYTKFDADGNVIEEGIIPMQISDDGTIKPQYAWRGIKMFNGDAVSFYPDGEQRGLYVYKDTNMSIRYQLDRPANHYVWIRAFSTPPYEWRSEGTLQTVTDTYKAPVTDHYLGYFASKSSDPFTINIFEIKF